MRTPMLLSLLLVCLSPAACGGDDGGSSSGGTSSGSSAGSGSGSSAGSSGASTGTSTSAGTSAGTGAGTSGTSGGSSGGTSAGTSAGSTGGAGDFVTLETTMGDIVLELDPVAAPITTANFLAYVDAGFYDGDDGLGATVFHRVISGFMIQGGGLTETLQTKSTMAPIVNEHGNGLTNLRGTIAMARTNDPDSATSQFFINLEDNTFLDDPPGYAVFGQVVTGMDVVDAIGAVATTSMPPYDDVPTTPIVIIDAYRGQP